MAAKKKKRSDFRVQVGDVQDLVEVPRPAMSRTVPFGTQPPEGDGEFDVQIGDAQDLVEVERPPMGRTVPFAGMPGESERPSMRVSESDVASADMPMGRTVPYGTQPPEGESPGLSVTVGEGSFRPSFYNNYDAAVPGNIDLSHRPHVMNADGSHSTVRSMSFQDRDGMEVLVPTVSDDGRVMTNEEAIAEYDRTGKHLGKFWSPEEATAAAESIHLDQEEYMPADTLAGPMERTVPFGTKPRRKARR